MSQKRKKTLPKCVRPKEFPLLIKVIPSKETYVKVAFLLAYGSGMRISEVVKCNKEHFRENSIFIPESKYGVDRIVPIPRGWKNSFLSFLPISRSMRTLERKFNKYSELAKLNPLYTFHSLRHGFAVRSLENGVPINQVQLLLGHSNLQTTSIYTKANPVDALKSYEEFF
jgi:integrase